MTAPVASYALKCISPRFGIDEDTVCRVVPEPDYYKLGIEHGGLGLGVYGPSFEPVFTETGLCIMTAAYSAGLNDEACATILNSYDQNGGFKAAWDTKQIALIRIFSGLPEVTE